MNLPCLFFINSALHFRNFNVLQDPTQNQKTNGPVNAHLISGPSISTKHTKPG